MKVRAREVPARKLDYLTVNKEYDVDEVGPSCGDIVDDEGDVLFIVFDGCSHLDGGDWEVVQEVAHE